MDALKVAIGLLPEISVLYQLGIIDISPHREPYVQITEDLMNKLFPEATPNEKGQYIYNLDGVNVIAIARDW